jgi:predicted nucleic acid-binding protein
MIVVSDTTPIHYLVEIEEIDLLPNLFNQIIIPPAVIIELRDPSTPRKVRDWIQSRPAWLELRRANTALFTPQKVIGNGEFEAFALALELKADAVLLDDRGATIEARRHNLRIIPTFAILEQAARKNLLDLPEAINKMRQTSFRLPPEKVIQGMLDRDLQWKKSQTQKPEGQ